FFSFDDTATTGIYTLSLHDALPIYPRGIRDGHLETGEGHHFGAQGDVDVVQRCTLQRLGGHEPIRVARSAFWTWSLFSASSRKRSEEHTSELQSRGHLVCRLLLEKK